MPSQMCMLHYNQLLQCTPHMESGLRPLPIYYNVYIMIQSTLWSHGSPSLSLSMSCTPSPSPSLPLFLSLSISPAPSPFVVLILCRASTPTGVWRLPSYRHHYLLQSCTLQNYVLTHSMQYHLLHLPTMSLSSVSPSYCVLSYYLGYCW